MDSPCFEWFLQEDVPKIASEEWLGLDELRGVVREVEALRSQVNSHEGRIQNVELVQAVQGQRITTVEGDLKEIKDNTKKIIWILITGFAGAIIAFIVNGGLKP